jgi:hypothetical protein
VARTPRQAPHPRILRGPVPQSLAGHVGEEGTAFPFVPQDRLGTTQRFLRAIGDARLIAPLRSEGGDRGYSRYQPPIAARARQLVDQGTPVEAACRLVVLEKPARGRPADQRRTPPNTAGPEYPTIAA